MYVTAFWLAFLHERDQTCNTKCKPDGMTTYQKSYNHKPPEGSQTLYKASPNLTPLDNALVILSSLGVIGSVLYTPILLKALYNYYKKHIRKASKTKKRIFVSLILASAWVCIVGPHRNPKVGEYLNFRHWRLWNAFVKYVAMEVRLDSSDTQYKYNLHKDQQAIVSVIPHGIFPFSLGLAALSDGVTTAFPKFRPIVGKSQSHP